MARFDKPNQLLDIDLSRLKEINLDNLVDVLENDMHINIYCNICNTEPIKGIRFKCDTCKDYDLCYDCYINKSADGSRTHSHEEHPIVLEKMGMIWSMTPVEDT